MDDEEWQMGLIGVYVYMIGNKDPRLSSILEILEFHPVLIPWMDKGRGEWFYNGIRLGVVPNFFDCDKKYLDDLEWRCKFGREGVLCK